MPKERNFNPVQAQRKADKAKAIKKGKAQVQSQRNERLAGKNPERIQQRIDELKAVTEGGGKLTRHEEQILEGLEKEIKAVRRARDTLGEKAPAFGRGYSREDGRGGGVLGKRRRDGDSDSDDDVPDDVKSIPMPRDTPPPIAKEILDEWYAKRRARRNNPNAEPLGGERKVPEPAPAPVEAKTVYEAKPIIRNLQKEAVSAFVPAVVRTKLEKGRGQGALLEPEEADQLEQEGYLKTRPASAMPAVPGDQGQPQVEPGPQAVAMEEVDDEEG